MGATRFKRNLGALCAAAAMVAVVAGPAFGAQTWTIQRSPNPKGSFYTELHGVACVSASSCFAVGAWTNDRGREFTLVERRNGSKWAVQSSANPKGGGPILFGVSCASPKSCMAVGYYTSPNLNEVTLAERWDGSAWKVVKTPNPNQPVSFLSGVACTSTTSCVAVGAAGETEQSPNRTLVERWNGSTWRIVASPIPHGFTGVRLTGVGCSSATACTAVGYSVQGLSTETMLAERWNGSKWKIQKTATPPGAKFSALASVACPSTTACTATGYYSDASGTGLTLAERWNGTKWSVQPTPNPGGVMASLLLGVSCASASACTAVGYAQALGGQILLAEQWDAGTWTLQFVPPPPSSQSPELESVACLSEQACTAGGTYENPSGVGKTLIEAST